MFPFSRCLLPGAYGATYQVERWLLDEEYYPIITGCIKIDYQSDTSPGTWTDVTAEILKLGWTGRNINPQVNKNGVPSFQSPPTQESLALGGQVAASGPTVKSGVTTVGCNDPSPNAIISLARVRDNPSNAAGGNSNASNKYCGNNPSSNGWSGGTNQTSKNCAGSGNTGRDCATTLGTDFWPLALFDTREGNLRDTGFAGNAVTLAGTMYYVELDVANLEKWFAGTLGSSGTSANDTTGYSVYFSDRRGEQQDPNPPPRWALLPCSPVASVTTISSIHPAPAAVPMIPSIRAKTLNPITQTVSPVIPALRRALTARLPSSTIPRLVPPPSLP